MSVGFDAESKFVIAKLCNDFVYFAGRGPYYTPHGAFMTKEGFEQFVGQHYGILNYTRLVKDPKTGTETEVEDTIPAATWWLNTRPAEKRVVSELVFEPGVQSPPEKFNTWDKLKHEMCEANPNANVSDVAILVEHLMFISGGETQAVIWILNWLAHLYQFPHVKIPSFIVFHSDFGGVGKSILKHLFAPVFGRSMVRSMSGHHLHEAFTDAIFGGRLVFVEEVAFENKRTTYEKFKDLVSEPQFTHNPKGRMAFQAMNTMHFIVCTNRKDALPLMKEDRRALVVSCSDRPKPQAYYKELGAWIKGPGPALLAGVLKNWDLREFEPDARPPSTAAAQQMYDETIPALDAYVCELIEERQPPFEKDFGFPAPLTTRLAVVHEASIAGMGLNSRSLARALRSAGAQRKSMRVSGDGDPQYVWIWRNIDRWLVETPAAREAHLQN